MANLARTRDNQPRARARRKGYLRDLEAKLRVCDQMSIKASIEMQTAARKVAKENDMLRIMLNQRGVSNDEINAVLSSSGLATGSQDAPSPVPSVALAGLLELETAVKSTCIEQLESVPVQPTEAASFISSNTTSALS